MIVRFIIFLIIIYVLYRVVKFLRTKKVADTDKPSLKSTPASREDLVEDPFCHTYIPLSQAYKQEIDGKSYCFCSKECYEKYLQGNNK